MNKNRNHAHRGPRRERPARPPAMVAYLLAPEVEVSERLALDNLRKGSNEPRHFNILADCADLLTIAAIFKGDEKTNAVGELASIALCNIRDRFEATGRLGGTGDELGALQMLINVAEDFWKRQSGELFFRAHRALEAARNEREAA